METTIKRKSPFYFGVKTKVFTDLISYLFILLFIYTASSKIFTFQDFNNVLHAVPIFGRYHLVISVLIISAEIIIGAMLIIPFTKRTGLLAALILMIIFTIYLIYMVSFEKVLPCSCGGVISHLSWKNHIWFNTGLIFLSSLSLLTNKP